MLVTVTDGPPDSDAVADVCQMTVTHLWKRVPAIEPVFAGQESALGTWHLPSEETLSQLLMTVSKCLVQED